MTEYLRLAAEAHQSRAVLAGLKRPIVTGQPTNAPNQPAKFKDQSTATSISDGAVKSLVHNRDLGCVRFFRACS